MASQEKKKSRKEIRRHLKVVVVNCLKYYLHLKEKVVEKGETNREKLEWIRLLDALSYFHIFVAIVKCWILFIFSLLRQAEEEYSKLKLRLEAIKRSQEEAAAKVALENKESAKITLENKGAVLERDKEDTERIANEYTNEPAAKENKDAISSEGGGMNEEEASVDENCQQVVSEVQEDLEKKEVAASENNEEEMQDGVVLPEKSNKRDEIENGTDGADEDLIPTFENQQENATTLLKVGADIEDIEPALMEKNVKNSNINIDPVSDDDEDDIANDALEVAVDFHEVEAYNQNPTTSSPPCQAIVLDDIEISDDDDSDDDDPELGQYVTTKIVAAIPKMKEVVEEEEEEEDFLNDAVDVATDEDEEIGSLQPALTEGEYEEGQHDCQTSGEDEDGEEILAVGVDLQEEDLIGNKDSDDDERDEAVEADEEKGDGAGHGADEEALGDQNIQPG